MTPTCRTPLSFGLTLACTLALSACGADLQLQELTTIAATPDSPNDAAPAVPVAADGNAAADANLMADANARVPTAPAPVPAIFGTALALSSFEQEVWPARKFNNEQENYTSGGKNVAFSDSGKSAVITARPTGGSSFTSARLSGPTLASLGGIPRYIEATIVAPMGNRTWPAFWLVSRGDWPQGSEVDVMEQANGAAESHISTHWGPTSGQTTFDTHEVIKNVNPAEKHRYGAFLTATGVQFYLDGTPVGSQVIFPTQAKFSTLAPNLVPVVNLAIGGNFPGGDAPQSIGTQVLTVIAISHSDHAP